MRSVLLNPKVSAQQKKEIFDARPAGASTSSRRPGRVLVDSHREVLIGSIAEQFEELKHEHEKVVRARITSAQPLTDAQRDDIVAALEKRYGKKVEAEVDVDPSSWAGARAGRRPSHPRLRA
jgi:F-type H+-transporting ATPase subunit delta